MVDYFYIFLKILLYIPTFDSTLHFTNRIHLLFFHSNTNSYIIHPHSNSIPISHSNPIYTVAISPHRRRTTIAYSFKTIHHSLWIWKNIIVRVCVSERERWNNWAHMSVPNFDPFFFVVVVLFFFIFNLTKFFFQI